jgi:hypothetical protein
MLRIRLDLTAARRRGFARKAVPRGAFFMSVSGLSRIARPSPFNNIFLKDRINAKSLGLKFQIQALP